MRNRRRFPDCLPRRPRSFHDSWRASRPAANRDRLGVTALQAQRSSSTPSHPHQRSRRLPRPALPRSPRVSRWPMRWSLGKSAAPRACNRGRSPERRNSFPRAESLPRRCRARTPLPCNAQFHRQASRRCNGRSCLPTRDGPRRPARQPARPQPLLGRWSVPSARRALPTAKHPSRPSPPLHPS